MSTHQVGVLLSLRLLIVPGLVLAGLALPHVLESGAHQGLAHQDAQVNKKEGIDGPEEDGDRNKNK